jgi:hypothetical protein
MIEFEEKTMRIAKGCVLFLAAMALLVVLPGQAAEKTAITAPIFFDPFNILGSGPIGSFADQGTVICPGRQPTGDPFQPCPAGSRVNFRGVVISRPLSSLDPRLNGLETAEFNADLDADGDGHYWGKWRIDLAGGGVWEGSYSGQISNVTDGVSLHIGKGEMHGQGGSVDGCLLKAGMVATAYLGGLATTGIYTGYILDPHAR